jgi:hypothetical protein
MKPEGTKLSNLNFTACTLLVGSLFTATINAATVSFGTTVTLSGGEILTSADTGQWFVPDQTSLSDLPQFNTAIGTLNSATLTIEGSLSYDTGFGGFDVADEEFANQMSIGNEVGVTGAVPIGGTNYWTPFASISDTGSCSEGPYTGPCFDFILGGDYINTSATFTGTDMAAFIGTGVLGGVDINLLVGLSSLTSDNLVGPDAFVWADFAGDVTVEYDFTVSAVPVPPAIWLLGSGLLGLVGIARRKA